MRYAAIALTVLVGLGIIFVGGWYLLAPQQAAKGFGLPAWPTDDSTAWLNLKGIRDIVSGLAVLIPLALGQFTIVAWLLLAAAITPLGDALTILRYRGNKTVAYAVHGATALVVILASALFLLG